MPRLAWAADLHLDHAEPSARERFVEEVRAAAPDLLLVAGDVGAATTTMTHLEQIQHAVGCPLWFVLGNHDFYGSSIATVRRTADALAAGNRALRWLSALGVVPVSRTTAVVGHDGWGDGRCGDYWGSTVLLNDVRLIEDLVWLEREALLARLNALGDEAAHHFATHVPEALARHARVIVVTHVPPFAEAAWHEGRQSDPEWLPYFACRAVGDVLRDLMAAHPDREMLVLCGHTHGAGELLALPNLRVLTAGADYGTPRLQGVLDVP